MVETKENDCHCVLVSAVVFVFVYYAGLIVKLFVFHAFSIPFRRRFRRHTAATALHVVELSRRSRKIGHSLSTGKFQFSVLTQFVRYFRSTIVLETDKIIFIALVCILFYGHAFRFRYARVCNMLMHTFDLCRMHFYDSMVLRLYEPFYVCAHEKDNMFRNRFSNDGIRNDSFLPS